MNHLIRVILVLCLATIAVAILIIANNRANPRPSHEIAVEDYVAYRRATAFPSLTIKQYRQARIPQNFRPGMSKSTFGNAIYYRTTRRYYEAQADVGVWPLTVTATTVPTPRYEAQPVASVWPLTVTATTVPTLTRGGYWGGKPMPYPPNDLWCAQLSSSDPGAPKVVLAGLHQDIYNAEWIVHEVTDPKTVLSDVGCEFSDQ
jgi:hypothetical protein